MKFSENRVEMYRRCVNKEFNSFQPVPSTNQNVLVSSIVNFFALFLNWKMAVG